ncbi:MAG TPA: hypothetical protein VHJ76_08075 [Actinomycetota bacterium]|nr:hypothetical protein [Actinomycetota bacterium]
MTAGDLSLVAAQLLAFTVVGWATARLLLRWTRWDDAGLAERAALTAVGFTVFAVVAMLLNVAARGGVFGTPWAVPVLACIPVFVWILRGLARADVEVLRDARWSVPLLLALVLAAVYLLPVLLNGSGVRSGDPPWHLGWTEQLLGGEPVPVGPAPDFARNAYPWGYHAVLASLVRLVPSTTALLAHETVHVALLASIPLVAAALARRVEPRAGTAAAFCTALVGGFGWVLAGGPAFVPSPRESRFGADLVVASPNSVYELLPPAIPRELGLVIAGAAAILLLDAVRRGTARSRVVAGSVAGLVGVVSVPMLFTALVWGVTASLFAGTRRVRAFLQTAAPAVLVFGLWAAPVAAGYLQHGGFVDITPRLGMEWPLPTALGAYGLLLPLALAGVVAVARSERGGVLAALLAASVALLGLAVARDVFDWTVWNNATLLHQGRMWPPVHLLAGALGGVAVVRVYGLVSSRSRVLAVAALGLGAAIAVASPVVASMEMHEILADHRSGFVYGGPDYERGSFLAEAAEVLDPDDVVAGGTDELLWGLFQVSGARLAHYDDPRLDGNDLRIRYAELSQQWDAAMAAGGFEPTHVVRPASGPVLEGVVAAGEFEGQEWELVEAR